MVDFTQGSVLRKIVRFSLPLLVGNLFQQLYTVVDSILLGRLVSPIALAAAGTVTPVTMLLLGVICGFTLGTGLMVAKATGKKDMDAVADLVRSTFLADMLVGTVLAGLAFVLAEPILRWMQTPDEVLEQAVLYLRIVSVGLIFQCLYQYLTDVLRGLGDSRTPLLFLVLATVLNIILDLFFILVVHMDVAGVAYATVIAQLLSALCCLAYSRRRYGELFLVNLRLRGVDVSLLKGSLALGLPSAMQQTVGSIGALGMQSVVNSFGAAAMNGYNAAYKADNFIMLPISTMGIALGTFVAQNVGAGNLPRVREGLKKTSIACGAMSVAASTLIFIFAEAMVQIFVTAEEVQTITIGAWGLRVLAVPYILCSQSNIFTSFFRGVGAVKVAFWISFAQVVIRLAICFGLSPIPAIGMNAVWFCMPITWAQVCLFSWVYYRSRRWEKGMKLGTV